MSTRTHKLPNYLRRYRRRSCLSQSDVAFLLGCKDSATACRYERNTRKPSLPAALAYEAIFGMPVRELFAGIYQRVEKKILRRAIQLQRRTTGRSLTRKTFLAQRAGIEIRQTETSQPPLLPKSDPPSRN